MNKSILPFDISPLNSGNVVDYDIRNEHGYEVAYLTYRDEQCTLPPDKWNVRLVLHSSDLPYKCALCGNRYHSPDVASCRVCGGDIISIASAGSEKKDKPNLKLRYYNKINCKDSLVNVGGRACLLLGTVEAVITDKAVFHDVYLLTFYDFYQSPTASAKYNILQFFYYDTSSGSFFIDAKLNELNKLLWNETVEHNYAIVPQWNVAKICEIYLNRSV